MAAPVDRHKTAISRQNLSRPVQQALDDGLVSNRASFFDYGCGRGDDLRHLSLLGIEATGWDPAHKPDVARTPSTVVNIGYVINVIEDPEERARALQQAWDLAQGVLVVSARLDWELTGFKGRPFSDGYLTGDNTFQRFYSQDELRAWIESTLGQKPVAASPGVFYVFRDVRLREELLARKTRGAAITRSVSELIYLENSDDLAELEDYVSNHGTLPSPLDLSNSEQLIEKFGSIRSAFRVIRQASSSHDWTSVDAGPATSSEKRFVQELETLQPLIDFLEARGRLPRAGETDFEPALADTFGSLGRAFSLIRRVSGEARWSDAASRARQNLLVYVALSNFGGRPKFSDLPDDIRYDVKDLVGPYKKACRLADEMLFELGDQTRVSELCAASPIGKLTPEALYLHVSALDHLHPLLRLYEGCARALSGEIPGHVVLKMHRLKPQISYLLYPDFDKVAHPAIHGSVVCRLATLDVDYRNYRKSRNPHILHRKELLVGPGYPLFERFSSLTRSEEQAGLLGQPGIGTQREWDQLLAESDIRIRGHKVVSRRK